MAETQLLLDLGLQGLEPEPDGIEDVPEDAPTSLWQTAGHSLLPIFQPAG